MTTPTTKLKDLRTVDLLGKLSRVSAQDVIRVLYALEAVALVYGVPDFEDAADECLGLRPTPENAAACERAYFDIRYQQEGRLKELIDSLVEKGELA